MNETWLYWVGCAGAFDQRNQQVARAVTALLTKAGVLFTTLGADEKCCGDPARRLGNEFLYQSLAEENAAAIVATGSAHVVTGCPHCYRVLKHEYELPGLEVLHHSQLLARLLSEGRPTTASRGLWPHRLPRLLLPGPLRGCLPGAETGAAGGLRPRAGGAAAVRVELLLLRRRGRPRVPRRGGG